MSAVLVREPEIQRLVEQAELELGVHVVRETHRKATVREIAKECGLLYIQERVGTRDDFEAFAATWFY